MVEPRKHQGLKPNLTHAVAARRKSCPDTKQTCSAARCAQRNFKRLRHSRHHALSTANIDLNQVFISLGEPEAHAVTTEHPAGCSKS
jgi:hypothetical protein